ncbi:MAG: protein kinase, partial [Verrucomicrobia bacterium]|nr:protein kinase [Verrucomicrobiota bacterium]
MENPVSNTSEPQTIFAHFRIMQGEDGSLCRLGKGSMGVTYKAIDTVLNRPVALKVITAELVHSPQAKYRFLREAQAAALIHHPNVATIFQFGEERDKYFYAMEFVEGEDLERYVSRRGPLSAATALQVVSQVAQALEAAQARKLIHRDIKPANIMAVANRNQKFDIKLIDFGLAKGGGEELDASMATRTQDFIGSPAFASPEQCETKELDIRSDIYSLGATLWYLLSGRPPFVGKLGEVLVAQVIKPPPFEELANTPESVTSLLARMLEKKPADRFQTPEELQEAIDQAIRQLKFDVTPEPLSLEDDGNLEAASPRESEAELTASPSSSFANYAKVQAGSLLSSRYRLLVEQRGGNAGRLFLARDELPGSHLPDELGIKLLHPRIGDDLPTLDLIENELQAVIRAPHPNLTQYFSLERSAEGAYLVREWLHGFALYEFLRWRRSLKAAEIFFLLDPLADTLDFLGDKGIGLLEVSVRKVLLHCPKAIQDFQALARGTASEWRACTLKLDPMSMASLITENTSHWDQTIVPDNRVLPKPESGTKTWGTSAVQSYAELTYELLSGRPPTQSREEFTQYVPISELDSSGNDILRSALVVDDPKLGYTNCRQLCDALKRSVSASRRTLTKTLGSSTPTARPSRENPSLTESKRKLFLLAGAALVLALVIGGLAIFAAIRFGTSLGQPSPTPSRTNPPATPVASPTPDVRKPFLSPSATTGSETPALNVAQAPTATPQSTPVQQDESKRLVIQLLQAIQTHDHANFLKYVDREIDYFGHKDASEAFIRKDMEQDARTYKSVRMVPDLSTLVSSSGHESVEYDLDAIDVLGKDHQARCRLEISFEPG